MCRGPIARPADPCNHRSIGKWLEVTGVQAAPGFLQLIAAIAVRLLVVWEPQRFLGGHHELLIRTRYSWHRISPAPGPRQGEDHGGEEKGQARRFRQATGRPEPALLGPPDLAGRTWRNVARPGRRAKDLRRIDAGGFQAAGQ